MSHRFPVLLIVTILLVGTSGISLAQFNDFQTRDPWPDARLRVPPINDDDEGEDNGLGFGKKIAGAWLGTGSFILDVDCDGVPDEGAEPTPFVADLQSFTASGLYLATNPTNPNLGHGSWKKTGNRQVSTNNIVFLNDPDGALLFIMRIPGVFDFDAGFMTANSTFGAIGYLPTQDPLDPTETPVFCTIGRHDLLRKVTVNP